ncbi:hypothetical protein HK099_002299 [Clydaea vesicula]|uniref:Uncharacterized protein n=1 Tax=Clydaea vesicula TaxID=447962 RepID=A0AAD5U2K5_9FUNG|nr:hypothetical protein HK099_002299 [Clydaea vesicula]KAJ3387307.1 hypothetical protein HDU92_002014 [Lobulomyces angularis]
MSSKSATLKERAEELDSTLKTLDQNMNLLKSNLKNGISNSITNTATSTHEVGSVVANNLQNDNSPENDKNNENALQIENKKLNFRIQILLRSIKEKDELLRANGLIEF